MEPIAGDVEAFHLDFADLDTSLLQGRLQAMSSISFIAAKLRKR
jgi:hypothetical protein